MSFSNKRVFMIFHLGASLGLGLLLALIAISTIHAQKPGDLDTTFGEDGIVTTTLGSPWEWGLGVAIQPDDKIVVVGERAGNNGVTFIILRYTVAGTLDSTFNVTNSGFITTPVADFASASDVVIQPTGEIVAAGYSGIEVDNDPLGSYFDYAFAVARYTTSGTLDSTFNGTGIVTTPISNESGPYGNSDVAVAVALQSQGEIVAAGYSGHNDDYGECDCDFAVVRYTPTGVPDSTFNNTGIVTTPIGGGDDKGGAVAIQLDGKIVVAGHSENEIGDADFALVRYTPTGTLDSTFGQNGIVTTPVSSGYDSLSSVAIQPDGKIVVAGYSGKSNSLNSNFAVARYTITGALDSTFGDTGIVTTSFSVDHEGYAVAIQPDDRIVVVGYSNNDADDEEYIGDLVVLRYTSAGDLDKTFHRTGIITTPIGSVQRDTAADVSIQSDGRIVVVGIDGEGETIDDYDTNIVVVRYLNHWHTTLFVPVILKE